jgi:hypothetical protein
MWTMASAMSSQFHHLRDLLYCGTVDQLHALDSRLGADHRPQDDEASLLAQAQAWILVAVYEFVKLGSGFRRPWTSVGRAIRLVQLLRLNEMDAGDGGFDMAVNAQTDPDAVIEMEERRRTFWMAFCLDRFACALDGLPQTLREPVGFLFDFLFFFFFLFSKVERKRGWAGSEEEEHDSIPRPIYQPANVFASFRRSQHAYPAQNMPSRAQPRS